jgi:hypothetical protein
MIRVASEQRVAEAHRSDEPERQNDMLPSLLVELDSPLTPGFMTAGYTALGRYIFLATCADEIEQSDCRRLVARG